MSQKQFARLGSELFGSAPIGQQDGWVFFHTSSENLASFFQFGNGLSGPLDQLDDRFRNSMAIADGACAARSRREEEDDALPSSTTTNEEIARNPRLPNGLRARVRTQTLSCADEHLRYIQFDLWAQQLSCYFGIDHLDGGVVLTQQSKVLFFTRLYRGAVFPTAVGPLMTETIISIANPNPEEIGIVLNCFGPDGQQLGQTRLRTIPSEGFIRETLSSLIGAGDPIGSGHLRVDVIEGPGAVGFELIQLPDSIFGLNAVTDTSAETVYSAQMANGGRAGVFNFTSLKLVNTSTQVRTVVVTAIADSGATIGTFQTTLNPSGSLQGDVSGLFSLGSNLGDLTTGSMQIVADGPGVIGDVVFGDPEAAAYAAALLLQSQSLSEAVLSQVAVGATNPADPSTHFFTGLALFVPGDSSVNVTVRVFDPQGRLKGQALVTLGARQRISSVITELIPSIETLIGGYIHIGSEGGSIVVQQLFGNSLLGFLSAVPPRIIR